MPHNSGTGEEGLDLTPAKIRAMNREELLSIWTSGQFQFLTDKQIDVANECMEALEIGIHYVAEDDGKGNRVVTPYGD